MKQQKRILIAEGDPESAERIRRLLPDDCEIILPQGGMDEESIWHSLSIHQPEMAFLALPREGELLLRLLKRVYDRRLPVACVLISDDSRMAWQAFQWNAADLMPRNFTEERFRQAERRARLLGGTRVRQVFIRTFGYFDVFVDGEALYFSNAKAKELLAVLVDEEGGTVSMEVCVDRLWPDRPYDDNVKQLYRKAVNYLNKLFEAEKLPVFSSGRGWCRVRRDGFNCDLYDVLEGKPHALDLYDGRYMFAYDWGEERVARLDLMKDDEMDWDA